MSGTSVLTGVSPSSVDNATRFSASLKPILPFINGGIAGMLATTCIQPIDMIKVRVQLAAGAPTSSTEVLREMVRRGAFLELYTGLSAALLRQATYTTTRLGLFQKSLGFLEERARLEGRKVGLFERAVAGVSAGGIAAIAGNPADLALVRMQADKFKSLESRRNHLGVTDTLWRIVKEEGIGGLWTGARPTVIRAMAMNFGQLAFFSETKARVKEYAPDAGKGSQLFCASATAGFFAVILSLPFDFLKTRLQEQNQQAVSGSRYRGMFHCAQCTLRDDGLLGFYRGFGTYYLRVAPQAYVFRCQRAHNLTNLVNRMITLVVADCLNLWTL